MFLYFSITKVHISFQNCQENNEKCCVKNVVFKFLTDVRKFTLYFEKFKVQYKRHKESYT